MVVPVTVRVVGPSADQIFLAHTLDATKDGVRLGGFHADLVAGEIIEVRHRHERAVFRVVWVKSSDKSSEKQVGAASVDGNGNIWDAELLKVQMNMRREMTDEEISIQ
jgi:hypothetical protein